MEGKGMEMYHAHSRIALHWLNEKSGSRFREVDASLKFISARLSEPGVDIEGVKKMIDRQCAQWLKTEMEKFLRPATLFNETKFEAYYAAKDQPIQKYGTQNQRSNPRLEGVSRNPINNYATAKRRVEPEMAPPADAPSEAVGA